MLNCNHYLTDPMASTTLYYDGDCAFCKWWIGYWKPQTGQRIIFEAKANLKAVQLVHGEEKSQGAHAVFQMLSFGAGKRIWLWMYRGLPGFAFLTEAAYRWIAAHRSIAFTITKLVWGTQPKPSTYHWVRRVFLGLIGLVYAIAFLSLFFQIPGLVGANGIWPAQLSEGILQLIALFGLGFAILPMIGIQRMPIFVLLWILYFILFRNGGPFLTFQWDTLLLEVGFLAIFFTPNWITPSIWLHRFLLFRLMFSSGVVKLLSGDLTYRDLTALNFHFETQPLPTPLGWYVHQLPEWADKGGLLVTFFIQLAIPFLLFAPRRIRFIAGGIMAALEILIALTGNYTFFNILTLALIFLLFDDQFFRRRKKRTSIKRKNWHRGFHKVLATLLIFFGMTALFGLFVPHRIRAPFYTVNRYGLFAVMTTVRNEIVIEGSQDGQTWQAYSFKYQPGDVNRAPPWVAPHQPRLDWQMWFAALGPYQRNPWFRNLTIRLLQGSPEVLALMETNPFPTVPPQFIRASYYEYHFTDTKTKKETGAWWTREFKGLYFPVVSLKDFQVR